MNSFEKNIVNIYREKGIAWLADLPKLVQQCEAFWELSQLTPFGNLSYNYVLSGYQKEKPVVLKLSVDIFSLEKEFKALEALKGYGAIQVLDYAKGALLLQKAVPGIQLKNHFPKNKNIILACQVMEKLHKAPLPKENNFPHIQEWLADLDKEWKIPDGYLKKARKLKNQLLQNPTTQILLHGDLHQDNILSNEEDWLIIDPKGVIGSPINEMWACIEDPKVDLEYISKYFNFKYDDVVKWYFVHLILAACWQVEDHLDPKTFLDLAEFVSPMIM